MTSQVPSLAGRVSGLTGSVYSRLVKEFGRYEGETYPLHVGDTWMGPPAGCAAEETRTADWPGMNRYTPVPGLPALREVIRQRVSSRTNVPVADDEVVVSMGATGGLLVSIGAIVEPGRDVLILAPAWPLVAGMVRLYGGRPIHVPFAGAVCDPEDVARILDAHRTDATVAVYVNTPNNPSGLVLDRVLLEALATWCRRQSLWLISDEVYEDFVYEGSHTYVRELAPERTISVWSCSKGFGMAGARVGWVVAPSTLISAARKLTTYTYYCAPHASQIAAMVALDGAGQAWVDQARPQYAQVGRAAAARLGVPAPQGSTFLFVDVAEALDGRPLDALLGDCVARGLLVAPGSAFGDYGTHIRVCFTAVEPSRTLRGIDVLAELLGR